LSALGVVVPGDEVAQCRVWVCGASLAQVDLQGAPAPVARLVTHGDEIDADAADNPATCEFACDRDPVLRELWGVVSVGGKAAAHEHLPVGPTDQLLVIRKHPDAQRAARRSATAMTLRRCRKPTL